MVDVSTLSGLRQTIGEFINKDSEQDFTKMGLGNDIYNINQLKAFLNKLSQLPLEGASNQQLIELNSRLQHLMVTINALIASHNSPNPNELTAKLIQFRAQFDSIFGSVVLLFQIISIQGSLVGDDLTRKEAAFNKYLEETKVKLEETKIKLERQVSSFDGLIEEISDKNKDLQVIKYAGLFEKESKEHTGNAYMWLAISFIFFLIIVFWLIYLLHGGIDQSFIDRMKAAKLSADDTQSLIVYHIIQQIVSKILIASALFYGLAFSVKAFRANRHNSIINKHRQNALGSFESFVNSPTADAATKNAVLLEATRTIFSHQATGYDTNDKDAEVPNKIIEIIKPVG